MVVDSSSYFCTRSLLYSGLSVSLFRAFDISVPSVTKADIRSEANQRCEYWRALEQMRAPARVPVVPVVAHASYLKRWAALRGSRPSPRRLPPSWQGAGFCAALDRYPSLVCHKE